MSQRKNQKSTTYDAKKNLISPAYDMGLGYDDSSSSSNNSESSNSFKFGNTNYEKNMIFSNTMKQPASIYDVNNPAYGINSMNMFSSLNKKNNNNNMFSTFNNLNNNNNKYDAYNIDINTNKYKK